MILARSMRMKEPRERRKSNARRREPSCACRVPTLIVLSFSPLSLLFLSSPYLSLSSLLICICSCLFFSENHCLIHFHPPRILRPQRHSTVSTTHSISLSPLYSLSPPQLFILSFSFSSPSSFSHVSVYNQRTFLWETRIDVQLDLSSLTHSLSHTRHTRKKERTNPLQTHV